MAFLILSRWFPALLCRLQGGREAQSKSGSQQGAGSEFQDAQGSLESVCTFPGNSAFHLHGGVVTDVGKCIELIERGLCNITRSCCGYMWAFSAAPLH